jgi:uncharacterized membrane protein YphA (DoxX/SURF4 family)
VRVEWLGWLNRQDISALQPILFVALENSSDGDDCEPGRKAGAVSGNLGNSAEIGTAAVALAAATATLAIPSEVIWSYSAAGLVLVAWLLTVIFRGDWQNTRRQNAAGFDKLILFGSLFYAMPIAAFGVEHFTETVGIASIVPAWIPWHRFWVYFVGACFIAAAFSLVTGIQARLSAGLLALTFFLFVALMDAPGFAQQPRDRFAQALLLRELSFGAGPLALAATLTGQQNKRCAHIAATVARYFIAVAVLFYSFEQFRHADHVPGIPLEMVTPTWIFAHSFWTYLAAAVYAVAGILLLIGKKSRSAAMGVGLTVLLVQLTVYVPIAWAERTSLEGLNYFFDTLMFGGTALLLAGAMPREEERGVN